ncbi:hypothetical protein D3C78_1427400 [compost metagenome]
MTGDQLLAGAGLADDQHAGVAGGDLLQVLEQGLRLGILEDLGGGPDRGGKGGGVRQGQQFHGDRYE